MDIPAVYTMFEDIQASQTKQLKMIEEIRSKPTTASAESAPALTSEDGKKIETLTEKLDRVDGKLDIPLRHHHTLDFTGNRALIALTVATIGFIASLWVIDYQRRALVNFRDNDLKYRYIQMRGEAISDDILRLREMFEFNRDPDSIKLIRRQVERYEQLVQQQAENEAQARLNDEQAKQLRQEAEAVKDGK
jgi:hypothetical protein